MRGFLLAVAAALLISGQASADQIKGEVRVSDGDTVSFSIRMFGIDTPEKRQQCKNRNGSCYACGQRAKEALREMVDDRTVTCKPTGAVTYGRIVAVCYVAGKDLHEAMLRQGWAVAYERYLDDVPGKKDAYLDAQKDAKDSKRGIWQGEFVTPSDWRNRDARVDGCGGN